VHWRNVGGARLANAPAVFCVLRNIFFFWAANKKYRYFQNDYLGGVETEKLKNLCFVGRGLGTSGFLIPVFDLPHRPPFSTKFRQCCCIFHAALTLRLLLMSYIYIYIYIYIYMEHLFLMFLDHTQRRTSVGRTPLDE